MMFTSTTLFTLSSWPAPNFGAENTNKHHFAHAQAICNVHVLESWQVACNDSAFSRGQDVEGEAHAERSSHGRQLIC